MTQPVKSSSRGLDLLFAAAVVNRKFRQMLLTDPEAALTQGYLGETFEVSERERERITSTRARSLKELAKKVTE